MKFVTSNISYIVGTLVRQYFFGKNPRQSFYIEFLFWMYVLHSYVLHFWLAFHSTKLTWTIVMNNTWICCVRYIGHHGIGVVTLITLMALCFNNILADVATNANIMFIGKLKSAMTSHDRRIWWLLLQILFHAFTCGYVYHDCSYFLSCVMILHMHIMEWNETQEILNQIFY